jgi:galactokinase
MTLQARVAEAFRTRWGAPPPLVVRAPGRVNLIGEHTDYNDGFVMPLAIDRGVCIALRPRPDDQIILHSLDFPEPAQFRLGGFQREAHGWAEYIKGVAWAMQAAGCALRGWEGVAAGDVPVGAGLSSSAALELAAARAFAAAARLPWEPVHMARLAQKAENDWVGVNCGIMDQLISAAGKQGHALLIDCRSLDTRPVQLPPGAAVVVLDTSTRRGLVESAYNERRAQCEAAARHFGVPALRDVPLAEFTARAAELDPLTRRRARHVISENARTLAAAVAMQAGDAARLGALMDASHASLRDDFEVTSDALNQMVIVARRQPGCYGARMTGAGFGGCAVALVDSAALERFVASVGIGYTQETARQPHLYICRAVDGASILEPDP